MDIAICEDMAEERKLLKDLIKMFLFERKIEHTVNDYDDGQKLLDSGSIESVDLFFLDIRLKGINGVQVGEKIRKKIKQHILFL